MKLSQFDFTLPSELIAQAPAKQRGESRLMVLQRKPHHVAHQQFADIDQYLQEGDVLVLNDTRVIPARLAARKVTGGKAEVFLERVLDKQRALVQIKMSKKILPGLRLLIGTGQTITVTDCCEGMFIITWQSEDAIEKLFQRYGDLPLPSYIQREATASDRQRYQTVYAKNDGAVAAPTAGLHFDKEMLLRLQRRGVEQAFITLHVGAGTFKPVRTHDIHQHRMHSERIELSAETCAQINAAKSEGRRVVAVGTTVVRCLESAVLADGRLAPMNGETDIFIYPGYEFSAIDALMTNFHLPQSTLLMLVSAFAGYEKMRSAYQSAIEEKYRFFSYGDAMLIV